MMPAIRLERIQWFDEAPVTLGDSEVNAYPGCDGMAIYEVMGDGIHGSLHAHQPFLRGESKAFPLIGNVWGWDGNREAPTLTPSFLVRWGGTPFMAHLFLQAGKVNLLADSTVVLA
jgi:hypothetical protein